MVTDVGNDGSCFYGGAGKLWAVEVKSAAPFELGARRALFDLPSTPLRSFWSVTGDGQRFVFAVNVEPQRQTFQYTVSAQRGG